METQVHTYERSSNVHPTVYLVSKLVHLFPGNQRVERRTYHTSKDCPMLARAGELVEVSEEWTEQHKFHECHKCWLERISQ